MMKLIRLFSSLVVAISMVHCASVPNDAQMQIQDGQAYLEVPNRGLDMAELRAHTLYGSSEFDQQGLSNLVMEDTDTIAFVSVTQKQSDQGILFGYQFPSHVESDLLNEFINSGEGARINVRSTALAMVMVNPLLMDTTLEQKVMIAEEAVTDQYFTKLVREIESHKILNPLEAINYDTTPDLFYHSSRVTIGAMKRIADRLPDTYAPQAVNTYRPGDVDTDMAYPEKRHDTQSGDKGIYIVNPKMNYYVAALRFTDDDNWENGYSYKVIPGKERWLDISIFPPKFEVVPPTETRFNEYPTDSRYIFISKGFQFNMSQQELFDSPPAKLALASNIYASFSMMIALVGDIGQLVPYAGGLIEWLSEELRNATSLDRVMGSVQLRVRESTVVAVEDLFREMAPAIEDYFNDMIDQGFSLGNIGTLLGGIISLVSGGSVVNMILDITTQVLPFYYDLFTSHAQAIYPWYNDGFNQMPNDPIVSNVIPDQPLNGRPVYVRGYGFGSADPNAKLLVNDVAIPAENIGSWENELIIAKLPADEQGEAANTPSGSRLRFAVQTKDGELTNEVVKAFEYVDVALQESGEGGGGGCTVAAVPGFNGALALQWLGLFAGLLLWRRRAMAA